MTNTVFTITGPTCAGKSTLARYMSERGIPEIRSFTTRAPRAGEVETHAYDFVTEDWVHKQRSDDVVELVHYNGNCYGCTVQQAMTKLREGNGVATIVVEPHGVGMWRKYAEGTGRFQHIAFYLNTPLNALIERFFGRLDENPSADLAYEMRRLRQLATVEYPNWPNATKYDAFANSNRDGFDWILGVIRARQRQAEAA